MKPQIIGISGSPVKDSNTDRLVRAVLEHSELETTFFKLSDYKVQPCHGCLGCVKDNICKVQDDFQEIAEQLKAADAFVIGGYPPYGTLDAFTKAFLERMFSMRHRKALNSGKLAVSIVTGNGRGATGLDEASEQIRLALSHEKIDVIGQIKATGNVKCTYCGSIETCPMSALPRMFNGDMKNVPTEYCRVEDQTETWQHAIALGVELGRQIARR